MIMTTISERQTSRDRVLDSLAHRAPGRTPFSWGFGPTHEMSAVLERQLRTTGLDWHRLRDAVDDIFAIDPPYIGPELPEQTDLWGIRRMAHSYGGGEYQEFAHHPLAGMDDLAAIRGYSWPSADWFDYSVLRERIRKGASDRRLAVKVSGGNVFETYCWMTGLEEALSNMIISPDVVEACLDHITSFYEQRLTRILEAAGDLIDIVFLADDLGGQQGLLLSRKLYRNIIQPTHMRLTATILRHAPHAKAMFHTDGAVFEIVPDLIDAGIQVLEAVQTDAAGMVPELLKSTYGTDLCFHGAISVQQLLPGGTPESIRSECSKLIEVFGRDGGYIAAPSHAVQQGTPVENILAMLEVVLGEQDYLAASTIAKL